MSVNVVMPSSYPSPRERKRPSRSLTGARIAAGPLHEGTICDGHVTCPWHNSEFALADGSVQRSPAVRPQPTAEVRVVDGRVQLRRSDEPRSLRRDSV